MAAVSGRMETWCRYLVQRERTNSFEDDINLCHRKRTVRAGWSTGAENLLSHLKGARDARSPQSNCSPKCRKHHTNVLVGVQTNGKFENRNVLMRRQQKMNRGRWGPIT